MTQTPVVLASTLDAVQVYRRGATITRRTTLAGPTLARGLPDEIELVGLPLALLDPTVKVRVTAVEPATSTVTAAGVRVGIAVRAAGEPPRAPDQKELDDVEATIREHEERLQLLDAELGLLRTIPVPDRPDAQPGRPPPPAPLHMRLALESFVDDAAERRRVERRDTAEALRRLHETLTRLHERRRAASSAAEVHQQDLSKSAVIPLRVDGERPTRVDIELSYVVPGARWSPAYQVKLARDGSTAVIQLRAHVAQRSGEDWKGVALKLSTAAPLSFTELPELPSIRIGRAQPPSPKKGFRPPPSGGQALFRDFDRDRDRAAQLVPAPTPWSMPDLAVSAFDLVGPSAPPVQTGSRSAARKRAPRAAHDASAHEQPRVFARARAPASFPAAAPAPDEDDALGFDDDGTGEGAVVEAMAHEERAVARAAPPPAPSTRPSATRPPAMARASGTGRGRSVAVDDDVVAALTFPLLRLPAADDAGRGRLTPVDLRAHYSESARRAGRPLSFEVLSVVQAAEHESTQVGGPLPPGAVDVGDFTSVFDYVYDADGRVDVGGDGGWHSVAVGDRECVAQVRFIAVPREEPHVYRVAALENPLAAPLLAGPAEVYVGGEYVLTTTLPAVAPKGELKLGLGVEQAIKVARNTRFSETRSGEGVVAMVELVHDVDIDVVNHLPRAIDIEVRERVPVPAPGAEVQVDERDVQPAWEPYAQDERDAPVEGGRRWRLSVAASATQKLHARYVLKVFSNAEVVGGNRRER
jgi:hypothetical protein